MRFSLLVLTGPDSGHSPRHALAFARALLEAGHELICVFFYDQGVLTASAAAETPQDELDIRRAWSDLGTSHNLKLVTCVASAVRFGLGDRDDSGDLLPGFQIGSLGDLVEASMGADRMVTFGD